MTLRDSLERTEFRASLAPEYLAGHAPATQHDNGRQPLEGASYFGLPAIKAPQWRWYVPAYFFVGGTAVGAYITATLADIVGRREDRGYVRAGRLVALLGLLLSPPLLVLDLGRPERFLNMLRVFKPRSMMNTGSWALSLFGLFGGLATLVELLELLGRRRPAWRVAAAVLRPLSWLGLLPAFYVGSYTGLLLSTTNVPLWARNHRLLGALFFSSAMSSGLAATTLATQLIGGATESNHHRMARAERVVLWTELALTLGSGLSLRGLARPLLAGRWGRRYVIGAIGAGIVAPLTLGDRPGALGVLRALLVLLGALTTRFAWTEAGKESADDPHAYFASTGATRSAAAGQQAGTPGPQQVADGHQPRRKRHGTLPRADLPTHGRIRGTITLVQEDRFRLEDDRGRGYLFTLGRGLGLGLQDLRQWSARGAQLEVDYEGAPDLGAVAVKVLERVD
jgi:formate-dependent nitrite reductase membrane component NrfD